MSQASVSAAAVPVSASADDGLSASLALLEQRFPQRIAELAGGRTSYRECGSATAPAIVLLHGIGSGGASWLHCALALENDARVIAWDAPGYGASSPLAPAAPSAADYAARLEQLLEALDVERCLLVGHSLGAMMAAAHVDGYAADGGGRVARLMLASPAQGYGAPEKRERAAQVIEERLGVLAALGVAGMAEQRSARTVSSQAGPQARAWARWNMSRLDPAGYAQAVRMLAGDDIQAYLPQARAGASAVPGEVICGSLDTVTTPADSRALATACNFPFLSIDGAGHACYVEQPALVAAAIRQANARRLSAT